MKHCPNPSCSFLAEMKEVAEFEDYVTHCKDCGTELVAGAAPNPAAMLREAQKQAMELELVAEFAALEDAESYRDRMELSGIPAVIEEVSPTEAVDEEDEEQVPWKARLFVRKGDLSAAFRVIDLIDAEVDAEEYDDEDEEADEAAAPATPGSFESKYPTLAEWVTTGGQITIGRDYDSGSAMVTITDPGGTVWESNEDYPSLDTLFAAAEQGLQEWMEENG